MTGHVTWFYNHGAGCCGVKHIYGFYDKPDENCAAAVVQTDIGAAARLFYNRARPVETARERLQAYLASYDSLRDSGVIEVVLAGSQIPVWREVLPEFGFKLVTETKNSNSGNMIAVFHRTPQYVKELKAASKAKTKQTSLRG